MCGLVVRSSVVLDLVATYALIPDISGDCYGSPHCILINLEHFLLGRCKQGGVRCSGREAGTINIEKYKHVQPTKVLNRTPWSLLVARPPPPPALFCPVAAAAVAAAATGAAGASVGAAVGGGKCWC
eukprot:1160482-Pelagomonas_calceolata.AAC.6